PHGMEMGPFCYYPELPREQAEQFNLLNREMMLETLLTSHAPMAAFSGYGLTIESPTIGKISSDHWNELRDALELNYEKVSDVPNFGQAHTTLELFELR
ncbi:MAG TPA: hypothetical protein VJ904_04975, partial [Tichowtungia sp.]|nr:hypothetical protein [Tichowtungia sp.]